MSLLQSVISLQRAMSRGIDGLLPREFRTDGNRDFLDRIVPARLSPGLRVCDVGGGKNPCIPLDRKLSLGLHVTGIDIDGDQLARAPEGAYDARVVADVSKYRGMGDADLVICQALLEHVADVEGAFEAMASMLRPGGRCLIFVPSRNALYARLNILLPERLKRALLFAIYPHAKRDQGFRAYYRDCTPSAFARLAAHNGMAIEQRELYWASSYFQFFAPLYAAWRAWVVAYRVIDPVDSAETFTYELVKQG
jgi:2-polyprenyl-6-hydroxyphenyl methylase/3-demethylubiquinone-9 3-methyltransferase